MDDYPMHYKKIFGLIFILVMLFHPTAGDAQMKLLNNEDLADICAGTGVTLWIKDISLEVTINSFKFTGTDGSAIEFKGIAVNGSTVNPLTGSSDGNSHAAYFSNIDDNVITYDIFTVENTSTTIDGKTILSIDNTNWNTTHTIASPNWTQQVYYSVDDIVFCTHSLGSMNIGSVNLHSTYTMLTANGRVGPAWETGISLDIDEFKYVYNTAPTSLAFQNIYLSGSASGTESDPSTWAFSGQFKIGDFGTPLGTGYNPADMNIITRDDNGKTVIVLNLPMSGSFRVKDVNFGGTDFGPIAIDGINVHSLNVEISP